MFPPNAGLVVIIVSSPGSGVLILQCKSYRGTITIIKKTFREARTGRLSSFGLVTCKTTQWPEEAEGLVLCAELLLVVVSWLDW